MAMSDEEITRLFRIRKTVMQMLQDRGCFVTDKEIQMERREFVQKYGENMKREDLVINKAKRNDSSDQVLFFFNGFNSFGKRNSISIVGSNLGCLSVAGG